MDNSTMEVINEIISKEPGPPNSIKLDFAPEELYLDLLDIFDFLLIFLTQLCKKLFPTSGGKIELESIDAQSIEIINLYLNSIGFKVIIEKIEFRNEIVDELQNGRFDKIVITPATKLYKLYIPIKSNNNIYIVRFDFINEI